MGRTGSLAVEKRALSECGKPVRGRIDKARIIRLWTESEFWTQQNIADICGCCVSTVRNVLKDNGFEHHYVSAGYIWTKMERTQRTK